jgi:hypothetical protein
VYYIGNLSYFLGFSMPCKCPVCGEMLPSAKKRDEHVAKAHPDKKKEKK